MTTSSSAPFPGLRPFARADARWFFGRESQIAALRSRLDRQRLIALVGGSGVGKSSLVYAGLLPQVEQEGDWCCLEMRPRGAPRDELANAFVRALLQSQLIDAEEARSAPLIDHVKTTLRRSAFGLVDLVNDWFAAGDKRLLLLVDQFEEIFRFVPQDDLAQPAEEEAPPFVSSLLTAAAASALPLYVVLTMRADYVGDCIRFDGLPEAISEGQYLVPRLTREEIASAIRQPVQRAGAEIDHDLVEQLLNDCAGQPDALPVLQHVLLRLWDASQPGSSAHRRLSIATYETIGLMRDALSRHADSVIHELHVTTPDQTAENLVGQVMRALTEIDHKGRAIRRPIPFGQLVDETGFSKSEVTQVVDAMRSDGRSFLRPDPQTELNDDTVIDVGHEAIIRLWRKIEDRDILDHDGRCKGWLRDEERDGRIYRALLEYAEESKRGDGAPLPRGQAEVRWNWWTQLRRTERWSHRYGGGWTRVVDLLERSMSAERWFLPLSGSEGGQISSAVELLVHTQACLRRLKDVDGSQAVPAAIRLLGPLRNDHNHQAVIEIAEAVSRLTPDIPIARRYYAQALLETGRVTAALDVLNMLVQSLAADDPETPEVAGLIALAHKVIFFDSKDRKSPAARNALSAAIDTYRATYYENRVANTWHGVNLLALLANAARLGIAVHGADDPAELARELLTTLRKIPLEHQDEWYLPMLAEVALGLGDPIEVARILRLYVDSPKVHAFHLTSTLRQFTKIWNLEDDEVGRSIVNILRAKTLQLTGGHVVLAPEEVTRVERQERPPEAQLKAILGAEGAKTYEWWNEGLQCARSVAAIREKLGQRVGTGFAVRAVDFGLGGPDEVLVLTCFHVVNADGADKGLQPHSTEVVFEGVDANRWYNVELLWSSPTDRCDASLLRLTPPLKGVQPLRLAKRLPLLDAPTRVFVIGHPGGRNLAFSMQDNELLDHEGPPDGKPLVPGVCRIHYRAPTEGGSGGSPVFNAHSWEVLGLHHMGGSEGMQRLNGVEGSYAANEGIWIQSIIAAVAAEHHSIRPAHGPRGGTVHSS